MMPENLSSSDFTKLMYFLSYKVYNCTTLQSMMNAKLSKQRFLTLLWKPANQDDSNDTPQPICECQADFPLLWIKAYPGLS